MARLRYGVGGGFYSKGGFSYVVPRLRVDFVRPPFSVPESQFVRKTGAINFIPMPIGIETTDWSVELIDSGLNLAAYYQKIEDFSSWLRAHDAIELYDLKMELKTWGLVEDDLSSWMSAYFESKENFKTLLLTWACQYKDFAGSFDAKGLKLEDVTTYLGVAKEKFKDLVMLLSVTDGVVLRDLAAFLSATNGFSLRDFGVFLRVVSSVPIFSSVVAQRVSAVVSEVS